MADLFPVQPPAEKLRILNGYRPDQDRLPLFIQGLDLLDHGIPFFFLAAVDHVGVFRTD
jgi:hypothetical protein